MMRKRNAFFATVLVLALGGTASAQQFGPISGAMSGPTGTSGTASSFFSRTMTRPDVSSTMSFRPTVPTPLNFNMMNLMPSLPSLADTLSLRSVFGSRPQMGYTQPKSPIPPPKKK